jgi:hypothetical protein
MVETLILADTDEVIQIVLTGIPGTEMDITAQYADYTASPSFTPGNQLGNSNGTTDQTIVSAPAGSTQRLIREITLKNQDASPVTFTLKYDKATAEKEVITATVAAGKTWLLSQALGESGGTMSSWNMTADSGTNQQVDDGETVDLEGGAGVTTTVGATNKWTIAVDPNKLVWVEDKEFPSAATTTTFSGLTGTDSYLLEFRLNNDNAGGCVYDVRINGDANSNDYAYQVDLRVGAADTIATTPNRSTFTFNQGSKELFGIMELGLTDGRFFAEAHSVAFAAADSLYLLDYGIQKNTDGVSSITSIEIVGDVANGLGIDTIIRLWKRTGD